MHVYQNVSKRLGIYAWVQTKASSHKLVHPALISVFHLRKLATVMLSFRAMASHESPETTL